MEGWGFRLLSGRRGAEGYIGGMEGERRLHASGLCPGETYQLYAAGTGRCLGSRAADSRGCLTWEAPEGVFLACGEQVMLWEKGAQGYSRAIHFLQRTDQDAAAPEEAEIGRRENTETSRPDTSGETETAREIRLRPAGESAPADALPLLIWPRGTEDVRDCRAKYPPIVPFDAPGWRFVRAPSPIRQAAYCAVGYCVEGDRVVGVAYALPGHPYRPPAALPGYRYYPGRGGAGYWIYWKKT